LRRCEHSNNRQRSDAIADFNCDVGRGSPDAPLLLVNHWLSVDPASQTVAAEVNSHDVLMQRAKQCATPAKPRPNIIAVDFYRSGDLFAVVDSLNGVR